MRKVVDQSVQEYLTEYLELHPDVLDSILSKSLNALKVLHKSQILNFLSPYSHVFFYSNIIVCNPYK